MVSRSCCYKCHIFMQEDSIMSVMVAVEDPRVSAFHAQLKSVMGKLLEQLLNNAVTEITQVYVDTTVVATREEEDGSSPQHKSSPSCKTPSPAPEDPASPPPPHRAISPDVPLKAEGLVSEPHRPVQHPTIVHVTSLARRDAYTQTGRSSLQPQHPKSAAPLKKELLEVLIGASPIDQDQAEVPVEQLNQPAAAADHPGKLTSELRPEKCRRDDLPQAELGGPSSTLSEAAEGNVPDENESDGRQADNMEEEDGPSSASKQGNADTDDQDQVVSREDSQQRVAATFEPLVLRARSVHRVAATRPETREQLVLRARSVPRRPGYIPKKKSGCNPHRNGTEMNPDETSQVSQMSCLASASVTQASSEPSVASEPSGYSSNLDVRQWNVPFKDVSDEEQPPDNVEEDDELPGPSSALKEESADAHRTPEELATKRLKSCVIELVKVNPLTCHFCRKTFMLRRALRRHLRLHTGEKPHACKRCDRSFALKSNLKKHHDTVHGGVEGSPPFYCEQCTKQFCSKSKLSVHVRVHTGEKPHRCIFCRRKRYRLKKNLVKHMLKHLGYAPRNMAVA